MKSLKLVLVGAFTLSLLSCSQEMQETEPTQPKNLISIEAANKQLDKYRTAHPGVNGSEFGLRTWISIEELENYIAWVKQESKKKNIEVNGIDFIYTQHKAGEPGMPNANNADYELTMMYAPTYKDGSHNVAFDPISSKENNPAKLSVLLAPKASKDSLTSEDTSAGRSSQGNGGGISGIGNNLNSCPNVCP